VSSMGYILGLITGIGLHIAFGNTLGIPHYIEPEWWHGAIVAILATLIYGIAVSLRRD
jgi:ABC-type antimicrobial peptide transport system permease subunit